MTKRSKSSYIAVSNARYPDNTVGAIDAPVDRADKNDIADSFLNLVDGGDITGPILYSGIPAGKIYLKEISVPTADLQECGSSPFILLSPLGANIVQSVIYISAKFIYDSETYDFVSVVIKKNGISSSQFFLNADLNASEDFFRYYSREGSEDIDNEDLVLTTEDGSDPTQGDGSLLLKIYYSIEDFN